MSSRQISLAFGIYIVLLAMRDIVAESRYGDIPRQVLLSHIFVVAFGLSLLLLSTQRRWRTTCSKLKNPHDVYLAVVLSILTLVIYSVTFFLLQTEIMGAGLFNMIDFGLNPILLSVIAVWHFQEHPRRNIKWGFMVFVIGMILMFSRRSFEGMIWIPVAVAGTAAMAISDSISKHMLGPRGFEKVELVAIRFAIPCAVALGYLATTSDRLTDWMTSFELLIYSAALAFLPLYVLYHVLGKANLSYLARWEIMLPLLVYAGTIRLHLSDLQWPPWPLFGALLVVVAFFLCEYETWPWKATGKDRAGHK